MILGQMGPRFKTGAGLSQLKGAEGVCPVSGGDQKGDNGDKELAWVQLPDKAFMMHGNSCCGWS